ncbi:hypothetical protein SEA_ZHENGYI_27 [Microbacterium phage Zhengyi]|nr:hypothetical protein SEA_ZHENGYI_27 [Microbacterium phage Zhengyi]
MVRAVHGPASHVSHGKGVNRGRTALRFTPCLAWKGSEPAMRDMGTRAANPPLVQVYLFQSSIRIFKRILVYHSTCH